MDETEDTVPETPDAKRLSFPDFEWSDDPEQVKRRLVDAMVVISENLRYLRLEAEARAAEETVNTKAIRMLTARVAKLESIVLPPGTSAER